MQRAPSFALAAALALLPAAASADFVVNSFENEDLDRPVRIAVNAADVATSGFSATAVTEGASSYEVVPNKTGASFLLRIDVLSNPGILDALAANPVVAFDVSVPVDADPADAFGGLGTVHIVNSLVGGFDASTPGSYYDDYVPYDGTVVESTFTLTEAQIADLEDPSNTYAEITLGVNVQAGEAIPTVYFDNVRVLAIPEPATLALLSLGGLALAGRRR